jgi:cell division protease FtsH
VDPVVLAKGTPGFSGADLENLVNEAALLAAKRDKEKLDMVDFEDSKDKVYMGLESKSKVIKEEDRKTTAYHEGGHALVARFLPNADAINKITIIPRGRAAGVTWFLPEERDFRYKDQLEDDLASLTAEGWRKKLSSIASAQERPTTSSKPRIWPSK